MTTPRRIIIALCALVALAVGLTAPALADDVTAGATPYTLGTTVTDELTDGSSDVYRLDLPTAEKVRVAFTGTMSEASFTWYDSASNGFGNGGSATSSSDLGYTDDVSLDAGTFYLGVEGKPGTYRLTVSSLVTLTFDAGGGHFGKGAPATTADYVLGSAVDRTPKAARKGYAFAGWFDGDARLSRTEPVTDPATYVARWTPKTYVVTYDVNGGRPLKKATKRVTFGTAFGKLPTPRGGPGQRFVGWFTQRAGGTKVTAATKLTTARNRTLHARWADGTASLRLATYKTIRSGSTVGTLSPKSVDASGTGLVFAQNMIYNHTITVFRSNGSFVKTIPSAVNLAKYGVKGYPAGTVNGGPVELAFTPDKKYAYVSNYSMYGPGFSREGHDVCSPSDHYDTSFVYRISLKTLKIDKVIPVGSVPKYVATSPDGKYVIVSNWCSYTESIISTKTNKVVKTIYVGRYPRGIVVSNDSSKAYVAVMGSTHLTVINLRKLTIAREIGIGNAPRHIVLSPDGKTAYVTLNGENRVARLNLATGAETKVSTGAAPRSMAISADGQSLYVVNYDSSTISKVSTATMRVVQTLPAPTHPIGITYDEKTGRVWVSCYSGVIEIFDQK